MTTTPTPEAVENGMGLRTGNTTLDVLTAERDALLARVDALTKEREANGIDYCALMERYDAATALAEHDKLVRAAALDEAAGVCQQHREVPDPLCPGSTIVVDLLGSPDDCAAAILARKEG